MDMTPDELRAELARLQAENARLRDRLDAKDEILTNTLKALAHAKEPDADADGKNVLVLYTNVRGWMWVMAKLGQFLIWLSAAAAAIYGLMRLIKGGG